MNKLWLYIACGVAIFLAGGIAIPETLKAIHGPEKVHVCPDCNCPEPTVSVQPFEVDKIKGLKEFNYAPSFSGSISVAGVDSTALRKMIDASMQRTFEKYSEPSKRRRR